MELSTNNMNFNHIKIKYTIPNETYCEINKDITNQTIMNIIDNIKSGYITSLTIEDTNLFLSFVILCENDLYFLGYIDTYNDQYYYFNDKTENTSLIEIDGNLYESKRICRNFEFVYKSIILFLQERKMMDSVDWIIE